MGSLGEMCMNWGNVAKGESPHSNPPNLLASFLRRSTVGSIDSDTIKLLGRWHSGAMARYLHQGSIGAMQQLPRAMLSHGKYNFLPDAAVPPRITNTPAIDDDALAIAANNSVDTATAPLATPQPRRPQRAQGLPPAAGPVPPLLQDFNPSPQRH